MENSNATLSHTFIIYISSKSMMLYIQTIRDKVYIHYCVTTIYYINFARIHAKKEFSSMNRKCMCSVHKPVYFMDARDVNNECLAWLFLYKFTSNFYTYLRTIYYTCFKGDGKSGLQRWWGKWWGQQMRVCRCEVNSVVLE